MEETLFISEAAKEIDVESHVLRYWEEELQLPIKRNELGHRYYTEEDLDIFRQIKGLKERGLQLKAIKMILKDGNPEWITDEKEEKRPAMAIEVVKGQEDADLAEREEKFRKVQGLLRTIFQEAMEENNKAMATEIRESLVKELDYQFRLREEWEEAREKRLDARDEVYYKKMDELLRKKSHRLFRAKEKGKQ